MSLPTPPEAPQKPAQKQETLSNVYLYDKNDISPIPLTYDVIDFGKPQGAASPLVGWAAGAFFAVGGLWNFFNLNGEGTIFAGILLCAIGSLLIAAGFFMNGYSIIANANGFRSGTANSGEVTEWPVDRGYFTVKVRVGANKTTRMAMNSATLTITFLLLFGHQILSQNQSQNLSLSQNQSPLQLCLPLMQPKLLHQGARRAFCLIQVTQAL